MIGQHEVARRPLITLAPGWPLRWAHAGLVLALVASALALGGAHVWVVLPTTCLIALCAVLARAGGSLRRLPAPALVMAGLGLYSLLQTLPLPIALLAKLSPHAADVWERSLRPLREPTTLGSLSLDPGASTLEAAKWLSYAVAFTLAASFGRRRGASSAIVVVFASAMLVAIATLAHGLVGATRVFGLYEPSFGPSRWHIGPMLNPNCLAGYLTLGALSGLGLMFSGRTTLPRWLWAAGVAILVGVGVLSGSRGGVVALVCGVLAFAVLMWRARVGREGLRRLGVLDWAGLGIALLSGLAFSALGARDTSLDQLFQRDMDKIRMSSWVIPMLRDFPGFGIGRGAFESVFPYYKTGIGNLVYANPENLVVQWVSEWGPLLGGLGLGVLAWQLRPSQVGFGHRVTTSGALIGVGALLLQNLVDFSLELVGPALAALFVLGACWGEARSAARVRSDAEESRAQWLGLLLTGMLCLSVGLAAWRGRTPVGFARQFAGNAYSSLRVEDNVATKEMWSDLRLAMQRHPAEPYFPRIGSMLALRTGSVDPMPWIERALDRALTNGHSHLILAHALRIHGYLDQALLEARLAAEYDPRLAREIGEDVAGWTQNLEKLQRAAPRGRSGAQVLFGATRALDAPEHGALREALLRDTIAHDPTLASAHRMFAEILLNQFTSERCSGAARQQCELDVERAGQALDKLNPASAVGVRILARLAIERQQPDAAEKLLTDRCATFEGRERVDCWRALFTLLRKHRQDRGIVQRVSQKYSKIACLIEQECERALIEAGDATAAVGDWVSALDYYERAARRRPTVPVFMKVADAAIQLGRITIAERALILAAARAGNDVKLANQISAKRDELLRSVIH